MKVRTSYNGIIILLIVLTVIFGLFLYKNRIKTVAYPIYNEFIGKKLERAINSYVVAHDRNYNIYYPDKGIPLGELKFKEYGDRVLEFFDLDTFKSVDIIMHNDKVFFHNLMGISLDRPTKGAYIGGKINILYDDTSLMPNIFVHELTHYVTAAIAKGNYPTWFAEGIALYMEYYILDYEWGEELGNVSHIYMTDLNDRFYDLDEYTAYRKSFEIVRDIIEEKGVEKLNQFLRELGKGKSFFKTFERYYGNILYKY